MISEAVARGSDPSGGGMRRWGFDTGMLRASFLALLLSTLYGLVFFVYSSTALRPSGLLFRIPRLGFLLHAVQGPGSGECRSLVIQVPEAQRRELGGKWAVVE